MSRSRIWFATEDESLSSVQHSTLSAACLEDNSSIRGNLSTLKTGPSIMLTSLSEDSRLTFYCFNLDGTSVVLSVRRRPSVTDVLWLNSKS